MKILFIGGNGNISWNCVEESLRAGHEVVEINRAMTRQTRREVQVGVRQIMADIRDKDRVLEILKDEKFDVVCDFICFNATQARDAISMFQNRTKQYIVISSEAVYERRSENLPFCEDAKQYEKNVDDLYILGKIEAEEVFKRAYKEQGFPVTIVRPGYTYDTIIPAPIGQNCFTAPEKYIEGYPLLMPGDGENLWSPLHSSDFAKAFIHLIGNKKVIGEEYHITGEILLTWNELADQLLEALGIRNKKIIHIPRNQALEIRGLHSHVILEQHMWHYIFDNSKIKSIAPEWKQEVQFCEGIRRTVDWLNEKEIRRRINPAYDKVLNDLYKIYGKGVSK